MTREEMIGDGALRRLSAETREVLRRYHEAFRNHGPTLQNHPDMSNRTGALTTNTSPA